MNYQITHTTKYSYSEAVPVCHNLVHLTPRSLINQSCDGFRLTVHPTPQQVSHRTDYFGNLTSYFSIDHAHRALSITATSRIQVTARSAPTTSPPWNEHVLRVARDRAPDYLDAYQFVFPSSNVSVFPGLRAYAEESFPAQRNLFDGVLELTERIYRDYTFDPRATTVQTPVEEVFEKKHGVCQDFAHLQIGCLRALGLPARYVSGYLRTDPPPGRPRLVGADASHAWLSVFCGEAGWVDFDPTNNVVVDTDHVTVAWGRDYQDVCPIQGVIVGGGEHRMQVSVDVAPTE